MRSAFLQLHHLVGCFETRKGRRHGALRPQKPLRLISDGDVGGSGIFFIPKTYTLHCHHQNDSALRWAAV